MEWFLDHFHQLLFIAVVLSAVFKFGKYHGKSEAIFTQIIETPDAIYKVQKIKDKT